VRITLIPWEIIWLVSLVVALIVGTLALFRWRLRRSWSWRWTTWFVGLGLAVVLIPGASWLLGYQFKLDRTHTTRTVVAHEKPQLRTHIYLEPHSEVFDASLQAVKSLNTWGFPWTITWRSTDASGGLIRAEVHVLFLTDDVFIFVRQFPNGTHVNLFSESRLTVGNLGENDRHVVQFYRALEERLGPPDLR
jgi:hypothetical protein